MSDIRPATPSDRDAIVETIVAAFAEDPAFTFFFGDRYSELAPGFAGYLFDKRVASGGAWVADDGEAVALWDPPTDVASDAVLSLPDGAARRLAGYDDAVEARLPTDPIWYLGILACNPSAAGRGLGRRVAEPGIQRASEDELPAILETTNPVNVGIYERAGWSDRDTITSVDPLTIWVMELSHFGGVESLRCLTPK